MRRGLFTEASNPRLAAYAARRASTTVLSLTVKSLADLELKSQGTTPVIASPVAWIVSQPFAHTSILVQAHHNRPGGQHRP